MSASARKLRVVQHAPQANGKGPGGIPLHYKNVGLFSDPFLDELVASRVDEPFLLRGWETEALPDFSKAYEWMLQNWDKYHEMIPNWSEAELEAKWVRPILEKLGWVYQTQVRVSKFGRREIPDYVLFDSEESYAKARKPYDNENYDAFFSNVLAVADAKKFGVSLDGSKQDNTNPSYQIVWYQKITGKRWGILTDGVYWRLYSAESKNKFSSYYEVNISKFLEARDDEAFKHFFNFFRKEAYVPDSISTQSFLDVVFANGERYASEVEKKLKDRAFHLVEMISQGFLEGRKSASDDELKEVYHHSLYYLFRLLFILNSEAKGLLNIGNQSDYYPYSLRALCDDLREDSERNKKWASASVSYNRVKDLFELIRKGDERIGIHGLGDEVFASGSAKFFKENSISDAYLNQVLLELSCLKGKDGRWRFVDYKRLSSDHVGSIFEGLLEFSLIRSGSEFALVNSSGERKTTGAYYTPDYIVDYIVTQTLEPLLKNKTAKGILEIKCADIAMGSGHFLLGVVRHLEERILEILATKDEPGIDPTEVRWLVLHNCVYGYDINPLAVELAKFSLWMYTARAGYQLEPLEDQLACRNSLSDPKSLQKQVSVTSGFDAVVGNPPYVRQESFVGAKEDLEERFETHHSMADLYVYFIEQARNLVKSEGKVGLIVANKWLKAEFGAPLRKWLVGNGLQSVLDFGDLPVFPGVAAYPCIVNLVKTAKPEKEVVYAKIAALPTEASSKLAFPKEVTRAKSADLGGEAWNFESTGDKKIAAKLDKVSLPLSKYIKDRAFYGIKTGLTEAFVVSEEARAKIVKSDKNSAKLFKPFLMGRDLKRYETIEAHRWLVFLPKGWTYKEFGQGHKDYWSLLRKKFPGIAQHFAPFEKEAKKRTDMGDFWWELRACDYYAEFSKPKIVYLKFQVQPIFTFDTDGGFFNDALWFIDSSDQFLLGFLNSKVAWWQMKRFCTQIQGGIQLIYKYMAKVPVPDPANLNALQVKEITTLVSKRLKTKSDDSRAEIELKIDQAFYKLLDLTTEEIGAIEKAAPLNKAQKRLEKQKLKGASTKKAA